MNARASAISRGGRALAAGLSTRLRLRLRKAKAERDKGAARLLGLIAIGLCIAVCVLGTAFGGGWYLAYKGAGELVRSGLSALYLGVFSALVLSSLGHAANAFFTAQDLWLWASAPAPFWARFFDRASETALAALPATSLLGALALVGLLTGYGAGLIATGRALLALALVALMPLSLGIGLAHVGGALLPAGRLRRLALLAVAVLVMLGLVVLRSARLEQLVTEEGARRFFEQARGVDTIGPGWLPSSLAAEFVIDGGFQELLWLATSSFSLLALALLSHRALYTRARDLADDEAPTGLRPGSLQERLLRAMTRVAAPDLRPSLEKDLLSFARDPSQWSQLVLLLGLAVLYLVNANALLLGFEQFPGVGNVVLAAVHVGLATFISAGLAARFAFTQLSLEGPAVWIVESSPLDARRLLRAKLYAALPVVFVFPSLIGAVGGVVLGLSFPSWLLTTSLIATQCFFLSAYGVGRGSEAPTFDAASVSELAMGPGALSTMAIAISLCAIASFSALLSGAALYRFDGVWALLALAPPLFPLGLAALAAKRALARGAVAFEHRREDGSAGTGAFAAGGGAR